MSGSKKEVTLNNDLDSVSYAIGIDIATNLKKSGFDNVNSDAIAKGFDDIFADKIPLIEPEAANRYVMDYFNKARDKKALENLENAEKFLSENKSKDGVITTESGLQYKIIKEGDGPKPQLTDKVKVSYKGTLIDGTEFDATEEGNPAQFRVNGVIKGWTEALQLMPVGSKWELYIHPDLAYGKNPRPGGAIQANDALIFDIELLEIVPDNK
ncbi:MAG: FKBP-type peptidyl-prolyl cis-trans isomerase [Bacteroidales bacterium]|nr:FKBP-type peptidyl-prolyl cis-trans isomerase [Bacteroidales bacterium]